MSAGLTDLSDSLPSRGARLHSSGGCTPCKFFRSKRGCKDDFHCKYCHFGHPELTPAGVRSVMRRHAMMRVQNMMAADISEPIPSDTARHAISTAAGLVAVHSSPGGGGHQPHQLELDAERTKFALFLRGGYTIRL